jgi:hypothetical protein
MVCPSVEALFEDYAKAALEYFEATDKVANLAGSMASLRKQRITQNRCAKNAVSPA